MFDHHAHPGFADDAEVDTAPSPPGALPLRLRPENPRLGGARGQRAVRRHAARARPEGSVSIRAPKYFNAILDRLGIETSMANRVAMAADLDPARFKWVFFVDCFMFPFDNSGARRAKPRPAASTCRTADQAAAAIRAAGSA